MDTLPDIEEPMEFERIIELLNEIVQRLDNISANLVVRSQMTMGQNVLRRRQQSLENYRVAYNRQHGFPDHMVHPPNPEPEGGYDEID
mgnify:FL=1